jgi:hypothetical protein
MNIILKHSVLPGKEHEIPHVLFELPHTLPSHFHNLCLVRNGEQAVQCPKWYKEESLGPISNTRKVQRPRWYMKKVQGPKRNKTAP